MRGGSTVSIKKSIIFFTLILLFSNAVHASDLRPPHQKSWAKKGPTASPSEAQYTKLSTTIEAFKQKRQAEKEEETSEEPVDPLDYYADDEGSESYSPTSEDDITIAFQETSYAEESDLPNLYNWPPAQIESYEQEARDYPGNL